MDEDKKKKKKKKFSFLKALGMKSTKTEPTIGNAANAIRKRKKAQLEALNY